ncbi:Hypothetical predicted protein [Mytilus galloprovincialis]|uniref:Novel STAND NTPase 3 domain-containing protein n=1 Tax=Mytilus galloprovincialis TaxID=29158 RepID=A0A8B6EBD7_MYTGA|nr:Hypothetical predicted protein [Mytilus galloprovincialis]
MGCMYLPPENTKYTSNEAFTEVEIEMIELVNKYNGQPLIVGDLNAKTKLLDDVVIPDDSLFDILDDFEDDSFVSYLYDYQNLCDSNVSLKRCSEDSSVPNNYGSQRGHARWVPDKENRFIETLVSDVTKFDEISLLLSEDSSTDPKERINTAVDKICDLFKSTANRVFKPKGRFYPSGTSNQLWFNKQCRDKRKGFHKAKNRYSLNKNKENRDEMKKSGKVYRTEMNKSFESFQHALESDMRKLSKKDSELIKKQIEDWEKKDKMFVSTRASDYVMEQLQDNSCLTLTAPSGVGKSFIARHTALLLKKEGYNIIPVYSPTDIKDYYQPGKQTVFIVDDICGNFTANQQQIDNWKQLLPVIKTIIADKCCKIIVSCRLQVYKDDKFKILSPFKSCECNLISDKLCLTSVEKTNIAKTYIGTSMTDIDDLSSKCDFFPLLCSLYHEKEDVDVKEFFKNPFDVYKSELDRLSEHGDEGNYKICSLALCVLFNNQLSEKWFQGKVTNEQRNIIEDTCEACKLNRGTSKAKLKEAIDTLDGTFICKQNGIYRTVHDKLFDFLAHYFGQKMIECLIDHGDSDLVHERFIWQKSSDDKNSNIDFIIEIPDDYLESYLQRFIKDWSVGKVTAVFSNNNMKVSSFRQKLLQYLLQLDKPQQVTLASTKDTVRPKEEYGSGNTPLIDNCYDGYTDMVQWLLHNDVDVDQSKDDGVTGLIMASQEGHTDIVKLLLEKDSNVDICDKDGNATNTILFNVQKENVEITKLLLENNVDCNICVHSKQSISDTLNNHPKDTMDTLDELKQDMFNVFVKNKSSHVADYVNKKSVDYAFDVVAGSSPLHLACFMGNIDIVSCLLHHNADINMTKEDGTTPLFFACEVGHEDIVCLLLDKGADKQICRLDGASPLTIATDNGHTSIVMMLKITQRKKKVKLSS